MFRFLIVVLSLCFLVGFSSYAIAGKIHRAAQRGKIEVVKQLVETGTPVEEKSSRGSTALFVASNYGRLDIVKYLILKGADVDAIGGDLPYYTGGNSLHAASQWGHIDVVKLLLATDIKHDYYDPDVGTPYHLAKKGGHKEVAALIKKKGIKIRLADPIEHMIAGADVNTGKNIAKDCQKCHQMDKTDIENKGLPLWNVVGRKKAANANFEYSLTLSSAGGIWNYNDLNQFLAKPEGYMPGTKMRAKGIADNQKRAALLAYLRALSDNPYPLPDTK